MNTPVFTTSGVVFTPQLNSDTRFQTYSTGAFSTGGFYSFTRKVNVNPGPLLISADYTLITGVNTTLVNSPIFGIQFFKNFVPIATIPVSFITDNDSFAAPGSCLVFPPVDLSGSSTNTPVNPFFYFKYVQSTAKGAIAIRPSYRIDIDCDTIIFSGGSVVNTINGGDHWDIGAGLTVAQI